MKLENAQVGDKFADITYQQYGSGLASAYDYVVVRAGKRDIICHALTPNGQVVENVGDGTPREFKFRRTDEVYEIGNQKVLDARKQIVGIIRHRKIVNFLQNTGNPKYDEEFMLAAEAFMERVTK